MKKNLTTFLLLVAFTCFSQTDSGIELVKKGPISQWKWVATNNHKQPVIFELKQKLTDCEGKVSVIIKKKTIYNTTKKGSTYIDDYGFKCGLSGKVYKKEYTFLSRKFKSKKKEDDFWSGKDEKTSAKKYADNFWNGKGSNSEESNFDKNTISKKSNQFIGEIESKTNSIKIVCRDHGQEDGDRVQIRNNKTIVKSNLYLTKSSKSVTLKLNFGMNRLDFKALNQGSSGANTAEFDIYDDNGKLISTKKWDLLTGYTGTLLIVKL
jgi:hypothetical protein